MAVIATSICTQTGKPLLSRLFRDLSKDKIASFLANFPSLLSKSESQNTTVEDENVRYVYQSVEECYIVLLTTKQSNILEDIETLHLFVNVVSHMLRRVDERGVFENAFELLSAFDEIVSMGYKEKLSVLQIQTFLEMESHEEKIQEIIEKNKELEAAEERRRRAKEIQRKEFERRTMEQQHAALYGGVSNAQLTRDTINYSMSTAPSYDVATPVTEHVAPMLAVPKLVVPKPIVGKGLKLGKRPNRLSEQGQPLLSGGPLLTTPRAQSQQTPLVALQEAPVASSVKSSASIQLQAESASVSPAPSATGGAGFKQPNNGILITVNERITAHLSREGGVTASEVKGDLNLRINNSELARSKIQVNVQNSDVQFKTHPNVDRELFTSERVIVLKDKRKSFPSNDQSLGVLRWRASDKNLQCVPILFTAWVSVEDGTADVTLEYEVSPQYLESHPSGHTFGKISVLVPVRLEDVILKDDTSGLVLYDIVDNGVEFIIAQIDTSSPLGSFEFSIPTSSDEDLFPMELGINSSTTNASDEDVALGGVSVVGVFSNGDEAPLPFDLHFNITSENLLLA